MSRRIFLKCHGMGPLTDFCPPLSKKIPYFSCGATHTLLLKVAAFPAQQSCFEVPEMGGSGARKKRSEAGRGKRKSLKGSTEKDSTECPKLSGSHRSTLIASDLASRRWHCKQSESRACRIARSLNTCRFFASQANIAGFSQDVNSKQAKGFSHR